MISGNLGEDGTLVKDLLKKEHPERCTPTHAIPPIPPTTITTLSHQLTTHAFPPILHTNITTLSHQLSTHAIPPTQHTSTPLQLAPQSKKPINFPSTRYKDHQYPELIERTRRQILTQELFEKTQTQKSIPVPTTVTAHALIQRTQAPFHELHSTDGSISFCESDFTDESCFTDYRSYYTPLHHPDQLPPRLDARLVTPLTRSQGKDLNSTLSTSSSLLLIVVPSFLARRHRMKIVSPSQVELDFNPSPCHQHTPVIWSYVWV